VRRSRQLPRTSARPAEATIPDRVPVRQGAWIRENVRDTLRARRQDPGTVAALTGLAPGTVRGFLKGRPSSIDNVLLIAEGHRLPNSRSSTSPPTSSASLLTTDSTAPMARSPQRSPCAGVGSRSSTLTPVPRSPDLACESSKCPRRTLTRGDVVWAVHPENHDPTVYRI
jgi:hypothetical protein